MLPGHPRRSGRDLCDLGHCRSAADPQDDPELRPASGERICGTIEVNLLNGEWLGDSLPLYAAPHRSSAVCFLAACSVFRTHPACGPLRGPDVCGFSITFRSHTPRWPNVIGFSTIFALRATPGPIVIGFSIKLGPRAAPRPIVIGFSITSAPHAAPRAIVIGFSITP